jgi:hypothetical protein
MPYTKLSLHNLIHFDRENFVLVINADNSNVQHHKSTRPKYLLIRYD